VSHLGPASSPSSPIWGSATSARGSGTCDGNRGYRATQLEASVTGGKLYLAAYAQRLGASGLTFFDDDVTDFFSPYVRGEERHVLDRPRQIAKAAQEIGKL
jgi:hypothetical protein